MAWVDLWVDGLGLFIHPPEPRGPGEPWFWAMNCDGGAEARVGRRRVSTSWPIPGAPLDTDPTPVWADGTAGSGATP